MSITAAHAEVYWDSLQGLSAAELMTPNPVSIRASASVGEATALLTDRAIGGAPVIDDVGRPTGVVSHSDLLSHDRERFDYLAGGLAGYYDSEMEVRGKKSPLPEGFEAVDVDRTRVAEIMTPVVFSVRPDTPAVQVLRELAALRVHRLFVVDDGGVLVGVISALDLLTRLAQEPPGLA
jgi:CBS-domain-containing membrane protein